METTELITCPKCKKRAEIHLVNGVEEHYCKDCEYTFTVEEDSE